MAEYTPTYYSVGLTGHYPRATGGYAPLSGSDALGKIRTAAFSYITDGTEISTQTVALAILPAGATIRGGHVSHGAMAEMDAVDIGLAGLDGSGYTDVANSVADDPDYFTEAVVNMNSAGFAKMGENQAEGYGKTLDKTCVVTLLFTDTGSGTATISIEVAGHVEYTLD